MLTWALLGAAMTGGAAEPAPPTPTSAALDCVASLSMPDCSAPVDDSFPSQVAPHVKGVCVPDCSGGDPACTPEPVPLGPDELTLYLGDTEIAAYFLDTGVSCEGEALLELDDLLSPGDYVVEVEGGSDLPFTVVSQKVETSLDVLCGCAVDPRAPEGQGGLVMALLVLLVRLRRRF